MSALHNWIIDAERYRILLSRHLSPSYFNLCHPSLSPSTHSSLQTQNAITGFISIFRLLFLICEHSVISFLKKALYHTLYHTFFSFYSAQALCIKLWLDQILHSMTLRKGKNEKTAYSSAVTAHSGYSITVCWWGSLCESFPIKKKMVTTLKGITELEHFWCEVDTAVKTVWRLHWPSPGDHQ